jgi:hypothetical protein
MEKPMEF